MFKIYDGREYFYQWDVDRKLIIEDPDVKEVHFTNRATNDAYVCLTYAEDGKTLVNVPNILLQTNWRIQAYAYDGKHTKHDKCYEVKSRSKPNDYIYTETEVVTVDKAVEIAIEEAKATGAFKDEELIKTVEDLAAQNDVAHELMTGEYMALGEKVVENEALLKIVDEDVGFIWEEIGDKVSYDDKVTANSIYEAIYNNVCDIEEAEANISEISNKVAKLNTDILKWQLLCEETLTEDAVYMYDLTDGGKRKCKGALYNAITPKGANLPGMMLQVLDKNRYVISQAYTWGDNTNTNVDKIRRICCKPENGYYTTYYGTSTSHQSYITRLNEISTYINYKRDTIYLGQIGSSVELPAGTIIKIWGLIEE